MNHICVAQGHHSCAVFNGALVAPDGTLGPVLELFGGQTCLEFSLQAAFFGNTFWGLGCLGRLKACTPSGGWAAGILRFVAHLCSPSQFFRRPMTISLARLSHPTTE